MMSSEHFRAWRKSLGWKQKEAAERLGLKKRMIQYYEKGNRDGKDVKIPKTVRLACYALSQGIDDFDGTSPTLAPASASAKAKDGAPPKKQGAKPAKPKKEGGKPDRAEKAEGDAARRGKKAAPRSAAATPAGDAAPAGLAVAAAPPQADSRTRIKD